MASSLVLLFVSSSLALATGFQKGNQFVATPISGQVTIVCENPPEPGGISGFFNCRDTILEPSPYDYFEGPKIDGNGQLILKAIHADGSTQEKNLSYDGSRGLSGAVNLWIHTIFQVPLLAIDENKIQFSLKDSRDQVVAQGDFSVTVDRGAPRTCQPTEYHSGDMSDCSSQYSICQKYFQEFNNCR